MIFEGYCHTCRTIRNLQLLEVSKGSSFTKYGLITYDVLAAERMVCMACGEFCPEVSPLIKVVDGEFVIDPDYAQDVQMMGCIDLGGFCRYDIEIVFLPVAPSIYGFLLLRWIGVDGPSETITKVRVRFERSI